MKVEYGVALDLNGLFTPRVSATWAVPKLDVASTIRAPSRLYRMSVGVLTIENNVGVGHSMTPSDLAENAERPIPALALLKHAYCSSRYYSMHYYSMHYSPRINHVLQENYPSLGISTLEMPRGLPRYRYGFCAAEPHRKH
jgi:hypothetical protein